MLGNGLALIVAGVGIQVDDAIAVLIEGVSASTHGVAGDGTNLAQVALLEAVGVVVVIIQAAVAIVIQGGDRQLQLVDHGVGQLGGGDGHAVIAGLDNAGNGVNVSAGGNTGGGVSINISRNQVRQSRTCGLSFHGSKVPVIFFCDSQEEILCGSVSGQAVKAPSGSSSGNVAFVSVTGSNAGINDLLCKRSAAFVNSIPESLLLLSGEQAVISVVLACLSNQLGQGGHAAAVIIQAGNGHGVQGGGTVIGRVHVNIQVEDDVINGDGGAVSEDQVIAHVDGIGNGAVSIFGHFAVSGAIVGVIGAVVLAGLTLDALQDHFALTVSAQQGNVGQVDNVLVSGRSGEERAELALKAGICQNQGAIAAAGIGSSGFAGSLAGSNRLSAAGSGRTAASQQARSHCNSHGQCKHLLGVFHVCITSQIILVMAAILTLPKGVLNKEKLKPFRICGVPSPQTNVTNNHVIISQFSISVNQKTPFWQHLSKSQQDNHNGTLNFVKFFRAAL